MNHTPLLLETTAFDAGSAQRIQHFIKVYELCRMIGTNEGLDEKTQDILETAAIVHDIGIKPSLTLYGDDAGPHQEALGPSEAQPMLKKLGYPEELIRRVRFAFCPHNSEIFSSAKFFCLQSWPSGL